MTHYDSHITAKLFPSKDARSEQLKARMESLKQEIAVLKKQKSLPPSFTYPRDNAAHLERFVASNILPMIRATPTGAITEGNDAFVKPAWLFT